MPARITIADADPEEVSALTAQLRAAGHEVRVIGRDFAPVPASIGEPAARILGRSAAMRAVRELVHRVAGMPRSTVLVTGESGVGKELVARAVHELSPRSARPFLALNCASLSESLLETELFGYVPGAFTGGRPGGGAGLVAAAEGGTLFLDEIGELVPAAQAKLLRFLQEKSYRRVGDACERACDVRVIAATNRDLAAAVESGSFREDLYYRLNVLSIRVPALRDHIEDLEELALDELSRLSEPRLSESWDGRTHSMSREALALLESHSWPGNVRELKNVIARAAVFAAGESIGAEHLELDVRGRRSYPGGTGVACSDGPRSLRDAEAELIRRAVSACEGNRSRAARELGIHRATLYNKMKLYGIEA